MSVENQTIVATILGIKRLSPSYYGNPRYELTTDRGTFRTRANAGYAYEIWNGWEGRTVAMSFDGRPSMRALVQATDKVSPFAAALIANGVSERRAIMWADANELRAGAFMQGSLDIKEEAEHINRIYAGI